MENKIIPFNNSDNKTQLKELLDEILRITAYPQDNFEIAALLESIGWNDRRAAEAFGAEDVFELSYWLWEMVDKNISVKPFIKERKSSFATHVVEILRSFFRGLIFALPMAISVFSMLILRFSLWSYEYLGIKEATSIAIGTILSFMTVGGFTQAIARRGFFYINQGYYNMCRRVTNYIVRMGYITFIIIALIFWIVDTVFRMLPMDMMTLSVIYYIFLSANWLSVTVLYILKKEIVFTGLLTFGIFIVWIFFEKLNLFGGSIIYPQIIALTCITIAGLILVNYFFRRAEKKGEKGISPPFPRISFMLYSLAPYFLYGFLYFTFLYCDRVVAWTVNGINIPYIIWLRGEYELGLDFALLMLIFPMGFAEYVVNRLMMALEDSQKNSTSHDTKSLNKKYLNLYIRSISMVLISAIISAIVTYFVVLFINNNATSFIKSRFEITETIYLVFVVALIAYSLLSVALTNAIILFSLSQPEMVSKVIMKSLVVDSIFGFLLSRWLRYDFAVFGLLIGVVVFMVLSMKNVLKVLRNLDYYIYAAT